MSRMAASQLHLHDVVCFFTRYPQFNAINPLGKNFTLKLLPAAQKAHTSAF